MMPDTAMVVDPHDLRLGPPAQVFLAYGCGRAVRPFITCHSALKM